MEILLKWIWNSFEKCMLLEMYDVKWEI